MLPSGTELIRGCRPPRSARHYLGHLAEVGLASLHARYGNTGWPEVEYRSLAR